MGRLPTGTVTFLFTDVEGSTRLLHELGAEAYRDALLEHRRVLRAAFAAHGGAEVDTQGDAFFAAFPTAPGALAAAEQLTEALGEGPIRVRVGLHTGTPLVTDEGYVGADVHRAARIAAAGHGGQVLVSAATASLLDGTRLRDLGAHRFKDLAAPERVYQVGDRGFPPLKTLYVTNLPVPATPFLGREDELAAVVELLGRDDARLVTLTGAGGSGKTRLALQAAAAAADAYPHGVWWVPLASVAEPGGVLPAVARALGADGPASDAVGDRRLLLLLDNFEHLVAAASELASLLGACPRLDVLVTSRERLRVDGEWVYPVPVLARPDARELFVARARAVRPGFEPDDALDELCARLDDLPLALELAAARTSMLSTRQLLERLGRRLDVLRGGRDADVRQQTLRATIEWSHDLLDDAERHLFAGLGVFRGGWTLEAAEEICAADLDTLQALVDKSLARVRHDGRFWLLETIREFALERLADRPDAAALRRRHAEHLLGVALAANLTADAAGPEDHSRVADEEANLHAALAWAADADPELGLRLAVALEQHWVVRDPADGYRLVSGLLGAAREVSPRLRADALRCCASVTYIFGEFERGARYVERALEAYRELGDEGMVGHMLFRLAIEADRLGDVERARELLDESLALTRRAGYRKGEPQTLAMLAELELKAGRTEEGLALLERSAATAGELGWTWWHAYALAALAEALLDAGEVAEAVARARTALELSLTIGDRQTAVFSLLLAAVAQARSGAPERAGRLWGAAEAEQARKPVGQWTEEYAKLEARLAGARDAAFERGREQGRMLTLDEAAGEALSLH